MSFGLDPLADRITSALAPALGVEASALQLERPREEKHGEFSLPCFRFSKAAGKNPAQLAGDLATDFAVDGITAAAAGPFLNFKVEPTLLAATVLEHVRSEAFGRADSDETTVVEFSSPNIAKPMHVGHLRSTVIGAALARIYGHLGHEVVRINHLGDWGSQFGKLVAGWQRWGDATKLEADPIGHLLEIYVRYHNEEKEDESLPADAKKAFQELECGDDNETRKTWRQFTELSLREFQRTYARLGTEFDFLRGESWYEDKLQDTLDFLETANILELDDGAWLVNLESEDIKTPCLVKTAHGTTLYATRDLAAARSRWEEFKFDRCLYVVGSEQILHFRQLKATLKRAGQAEWSERIEHITFGLIRLAEGKMSTRAGLVLTLAEVLDRAAELAREVIAEKNPDLPDADIIAEQVAVGAIVFHDLKHQRQKDVVFDWNEVLSFEGDTGPYLQYTHARCCSILRKAEKAAPAWGEFDPALLPESRDLMVAIGRFPQAIREAAVKNEPMLIAQALLKIGQAGNSFYRNCPVLKAETTELGDARLAVMDSLRSVLAMGLGLLGVPTPHEM